MYHLFDKDMAVQYGLEEAIIFNHFAFWIEKNEANEANYHDGTYWTYSSVKALYEIFPYMTQKKISAALNHLKDEGLIKTGNYNTSPYDRTMWYAFTDLGKSIIPKGKMDYPKTGTSIIPKGKMEIPKRENGFPEMGEPIPDILTDKLTDKKRKDILTDKKEKNKEKIQQEFNELWKLYPRKLGKDKALSAYSKARQEGTLKEDVEKGLRKYVEYIRTNKVEERYIKHGATWFNQKCWQDDYEIIQDFQQAPDAYDISKW